MPEDRGYPKGELIRKLRPHQEMGVVPRNNDLVSPSNGDESQRFEISGFAQLTDWLPVQRRNTGRSHPDDFQFFIEEIDDFGCSGHAKDVCDLSYAFLLVVSR
jgi:hypothetical protein